jgi:hypothetical protein
MEGVTCIINHTCMCSPRENKSNLSFMSIPNLFLFQHQVLVQKYEQQKGLRIKC